MNSTTKSAILESTTPENIERFFILEVHRLPHALWCSEVVTLERASISALY